MIANGGEGFNSADFDAADFNSVDFDDDDFVSSAVLLQSWHPDSPVKAAKPSA